MPDHQDADAYRLQAKLWQEKADTFSGGEERDVYLIIADGYARLAALIEQRVIDDAHTRLACGIDQSQQSTIG